LTAAESIVKRQRWRRLRHSLLLLLALAATLATATGLLLGGGLIWMDTGPGQRWLVARLNAMLADDGVVLERIRGSLFDDFTLASLRLSDSEGVWLEARDISVQWRPRALLGRHAAIDRLQVGAVRLLRLPADDSDTADPAGNWLSLPTLPELPVSLGLARLDAPRIDIDAAALGQKARLALGAADIRYAPGIAALNLQIARQDSDADSFVIDLAYDRPAARLDLKTEIAGAPGGLLAQLAGAADGESVELALTGDGPLDRWTGHLRARRGEGARFEAELSHDGATLHVSGAAAQQGLLPPDMQQLLGSRADIRLTAGLDRRPALPIELSVTTQAGRADISGTATAGDGDAVGLDFNWRIASPGGLSLPSREIALEAFEASGQLGGALAAPTFTIEADLRDARLPGGAGLQSLRLQADGRWTGQALDTRAGLQVSGLATEQSAPVDASLDVTGRYTAQDDLIALSDWRLESTGATLTGSGRYGLTDGALAVDGRVLRLDLGALPVPVPVPVSGGLAGRLGLDKPDASAPLAVTVDLSGQAIGGLDPAIMDLLGATPRLTASLELDGERLRLAAATLSGAHAVLETEGRIGLEGPDLALDYRLSLRDLARLYPAAEAQAGAIAISGRVTGRPDTLRATADSRLDAATLQGVTLIDLALSAEGRDLAGLPELTVSLTARSGLGPLDARLEAAMAADGAIAIPALAVSLGRLQASGDLRIRADRLAEGRISGRIAAAEDDGPRDAIAGSGDFSVDLDEREGRQGLRLVAAGQGLRIDPARGALTTVESFSLDGDLRLDGSLPTGSLSLDIKNADRGFSRFSSVALTARATAASAVIDAVAKGDWRGPLDLATTIEASDLATRPALTISTAGSLFGLPVETVTPPTLQRTSGGWSLSDMDLRLGEGRLAARGRTGPQAFALHVDAKGLPLELLSAALPMLSPSGRFDLQADVEQTDGSVAGKAAMRVSGLKPLTPGLVDAPSLDLDLDATLAADRLNIKGDAKGASGLTATLSAELPFIVDPAAAGIAMPQDADFNAALDWQGDIAPIFMSFDLPTHEAQGRLEAVIRASGTLGEPQLDGSLRLADGRYEHIDSGFLADDLHAAMRLSNDRIVLDELTATDGGGGRLSGGGHVLPGDGGLATADLTLAVQQMTLIRRSDASATVSGDIAYRLEDGQGVVSGRVTPERAEISIARDLPSDIQTLEVVELTPRETEAPRQREAARLRNLPTRLDLAVEANNRLFVRGRGLDSEWRADMRISGASDAPRLQGSARLVKGVFDFAGHRFTLDEGELLFAGGARIDPDLRIVASETVNGADFRITLTGRASSPQISLSSTPALPEDEILARLLFGDSVGNLSALEAVQLASALSSLSGGGGDFDLVGKLRGTLGLDRLSVDLGGDSGGATFSGGKYLTDDVYFELAAETATGETRGVVNWDLTRNLNLRGTVASSRDSTISLRWRWSY